MKTLYLDCFAGVSGDMFLGMLLDLGLDFQQLEQELRKIPIGGYQLKLQKVEKAGLQAASFKVFLDSPDGSPQLADAEFQEVDFAHHHSHPDTGHENEPHKVESSTAAHHLHPADTSRSDQEQQMTTVRVLCNTSIDHVPQAKAILESCAEVTYASHDYPHLVEVIADYDALIVLGGEMGDGDTAAHPWLEGVREALREAHDLERERTGQDAGLEREDALEGAALVQAEHGAPIGGGVEAELHLVPVAGRGRRGPDGPHRRLGDAAEVPQRVAHLPLLQGELLAVAEVEEAAAAALGGGEVRAGGGDAQRGGALDALQAGLCPAALDAGDPRQHPVAGQPAVHEHDPALVPGEGLPAQRDVGDLEF